MSEAHHVSAWVHKPLPASTAAVFQLPALIAIQVSVKSSRSSFVSATSVVDVNSLDTTIYRRGLAHGSSSLVGPVLVTCMCMHATCMLMLGSSLCTVHCILDK